MRRVLVSVLALFAMPAASAMADEFDGYYVGASYDWAMSEFLAEKESGYVIAAQVGYNAPVSGRVVAGIEFSMDVDSLSDPAFFYEVRPRLGYVLGGGDVMAYVTGGFTGFYAEWDGEKVDASGAIYGAGVEWAAFENVHLRTEVLHSQVDFYGFALDVTRVRLGASINF